jgi:tetratricopeptide (TPR) repeat protein
MGWLWFLGTLVPVIGLVQVGGQALADRYTYVPLLGIFIALTFEGKLWGERWSVDWLGPGLVCGMLLIACVLLTERQIGFWRNSITLFGHAIAVTKENPIAHVNLGIAFEEAGRPSEALNEYLLTVQLDPTLVQGHNNLGNLYDKLGKTNEALEQYQAALRRNPAAYLVHANLGRLLAKLGSLEDATHHYQEAIRLQPREPRFHSALGKLLLRLGRDADAIKQLQEALKLDPGDLKAQVFLARVLATDNDPHVRDAGQATALAERANAATGGEDPFVLDTLAMAYAESGRFVEAQQTVRKALDRADKQADADAIAVLQQQLHQYQLQQPYREIFTNADLDQLSK